MTLGSSLRGLFAVLAMLSCHLQRPAPLPRLLGCELLAAAAQPGEYPALYAAAGGPLILVGEAAWACPCGQARRLGGDAEDRRLDGDDEARRLAGDEEARKLAGDTEDRDLAGDEERRK